MDLVKKCPACQLEWPPDKQLCTCNASLMGLSLTAPMSKAEREPEPDRESGPEPRPEPGAVVVELKFPWDWESVTETTMLGREDNRFADRIKGSPNGGYVSKRHALLLIEAGAVTVRHLSQTNQTLVNDVPVRDESPLRDGDVLKLSLHYPLDIRLRQG